MPMRVMVNGREVTNPAVRALAAMVMMSVIALVLALLVFVALPLAGIALGAAMGLLAVGAGSLLVGLPIAIRRGLIGGRRERPRDDRDPDLEGRTPVDLAGGRLSNRSSDDEV